MQNVRILSESNEDGTNTRILITPKKAGLCEPDTDITPRRTIAYDSARDGQANVQTYKRAEQDHGCRVAITNAGSVFECHIHKKEHTYSPLALYAGLVYRNYGPVI